MHAYQQSYQHHMHTYQSFLSHFSALCCSSLCMIASILRMSFSSLSCFPGKRYGNIWIAMATICLRIWQRFLPFSGVLKMAICSGFSLSGGFVVSFRFGGFVLVVVAVPNIFGIVNLYFTRQPDKLLSHFCSKKVLKFQFPKKSLKIHSQLENLPFPLETATRMPMIRSRRRSTRVPTTTLFLSCGRCGISIRNISIVNLYLQGCHQSWLSHVEVLLVFTL